MVARASVSTCVASSTQLPQLAPAPVRMVSSDIVLQPASAAWRMSLSVTPLQMQTYTSSNPAGSPSLQDGFDYE